VIEDSGRVLARGAGSAATPATRAGMALLATLPLVTGAGLILHVVSGRSLALAVLLALAASLLLVTLTWRRLAPGTKEVARRRVIVGLACGALATLAYDVTRFALVTLGQLRFGPFEALPTFGRLLIGDSAPPVLVALAGTAFHAANGIGFGTAFVIAVRRPTILKGLVWAGLLELAMVTIYPGWLGMDLSEEFLTVSILGHAAYGSILGLAAGRLLAARGGSG
jgi:hypothetical protein